MASFQGSLRFFVPGRLGAAGYASTKARFHGTLYLLLFQKVAVTMK